MPAQVHTLFCFSWPQHKHMYILTVLSRTPPSTTARSSSETASRTNTTAPPANERAVYARSAAAAAVATPATWKLHWKRLQRVQGTCKDWTYSSIHQVSSFNYLNKTLFFFSVKNRHCSIRFRTCCAYTRSLMYDMIKKKEFFWYDLSWVLKKAGVADERSPFFCYRECKKLEENYYLSSNPVLNIVLYWSSSKRSTCMYSTYIRAISKILSQSKRFLLQEYWTLNELILILLYYYYSIVS